MSGASWAQTAGTVFLGLVGLWLVHNYRRQIQLKLAERRVDSYMELWGLTAAATPERIEPLDGSERNRLYEEMVRWYFNNAHGIFLSMPARNLFVTVRHNLVCSVESMQPQTLATQMVSMTPSDAERRRGCVSIRQASLLRSQLKADLEMPR